MRGVWAAVAAGFLLRAAFGLVYWTGKPLTHDEREYLTLATNLAQGRGFVQELPGEPADPDVQRFGRAPGYPLFLAPLTLTSPELRAGRLPDDVPTAVKVVQSAVGAIGIWFIAAIAWRAAGRRAGITAAVVAAVYPPLVWICAYALSEALYSTLAMGAVWALGAVTDRMRTGDARVPAAAEPAQAADGQRHDRRAAAGDEAWTVPLAVRGVHATFFPGDLAAIAVAGVLTGLAALTRPAMPLFVPLAMGLLIWRSIDRRAGLVRAAVFAALVALTILPWTVRNALVHERFIPIAASGGVNFWAGNHREAVGEGDLAANPHLKVLNQELRARHAGSSEEELERVYYREAFRFIAEDPVRWAGLLARKAWFSVVPLGPSYRLHSPLYFWGSVLPYLAVLPFAVAGSVRLGAGRAPWALYALGAASFLTFLVFFPQERYRIPVIDPLLIVCAAALRRK